MTGQKTTNDNELSLGLLRQRRILMLISIILPLFIYGIVSIENIEMLSGINIDVEQLYIKYILVALLVYFLVRYWQYAKVDAKRINLVEQMKGQSDNTKREFFKWIACPSAKDCFGVKDCNTVVEKDDLLESKNNGWFRKYKNIEVYGVANKYAKIKQEGWIEVKKTATLTFSKAFPYNWLILEIVLFCIKVKFYFTSAYFTDYLLPYYLAATAFSVFIADFFALSVFIAIPCAIALVIFKNSKHYQKIQRKIKQIISSNERAKKYLVLCEK